MSVQRIVQAVHRYVTTLQGATSVLASWAIVLMVTNTLAMVSGSCHVSHNIVLLWSTDINECNTNNGGCFHNCHNTIGSYYCTCNIGFLLDNDYHNCSGINTVQLYHLIIS